jgi:anoctamin-10
MLFAASAPTVLGIYRFTAIRSTNFERHDTHSAYSYSLAIKRFILSTIVSYFGIALSAFIYMPFGRDVLGSLHLQLFAFDLMGMTSPLAGEEDELLWEHDLLKASTKLNTTRLQTQMFAFLVTAQLANAFQELGAPYVIRWLKSCVSPPTKRPGDRSGTQDEKLLVRIQEEVSTRLDYDIFDDYCEMVTQFGYIAIWSSIWPLAPGEISSNFSRQWVNRKYFVQLWLVSITG